MSDGRLVQFANNEINEFGMPTKYKLYFVGSRDAKPGEAQAEFGIATIAQIAGDPSQLALPSNFVAAPGGATGAAIEAVRRLAEVNPGLVWNSWPSSWHQPL